MNVTQLVSSVLLFLGVGIVTVSCISTAIMSDPLDRLHMISPAAMLGSVLLCAGVAVHTGLTSSGIIALVVGVILIGTNPFISHAMARSIVVRQRFDHDDDLSQRQESSGA